MNDSQKNISKTTRTKPNIFENNNIIPIKIFSTNPTNKQTKQKRVYYSSITR
jgi:hypothetical protein